MNIRNARCADGFAFKATDAKEETLAECVVRPEDRSGLFPERPLGFAITISGDSGAYMRLLGAALTAAMRVARERDVPARVWVECAPGDVELTEALEALGFLPGDALAVMRRRIVPGPTIGRLPEGCVPVADDLSDSQERAFFEARLKGVFGVADPEGWMDEASSRVGFRRLLLAARDGLAGEVVVARDGSVGEVKLFYTAPQWRRRGVALYLLEAARKYFLNLRVDEAELMLRTLTPGAVATAASAGYRRERVLALYHGMDI